MLTRKKMCRWLTGSKRAWHLPTLSDSTGTSITTCTHLNTASLNEGVFLPSPGQDETSISKARPRHTIIITLSLQPRQLRPPPKQPHPLMHTRRVATPQPHRRDYQRCGSPQRHRHENGRRPHRRRHCSCARVPYRRSDHHRNSTTHYLHFHATRRRVLPMRRTQPIGWSCLGTTITEYVPC